MKKGLIKVTGPEGCWEVVLCWNSVISLQEIFLQAAGFWCLPITCLSFFSLLLQMHPRILSVPVPSRQRLWVFKTFFLGWIICLINYMCEWISKCTSVNMMPTTEITYFLLAKEQKKNQQLNRQQLQLLNEQESGFASLNHLFCLVI